MGRPGSTAPRSWAERCFPKLIQGTRWGKAATSRPGNSRSSFQKRFARASYRCANSEEAWSAGRAAALRGGSCPFKTDEEGKGEYALLSLSEYSAPGGLREGPERAAPSLGRWRKRRSADGRVAMTEHAVVIAGGGPTGLMLAGELALAGVDAVIVERRANQDLAGSRAGGLLSRTIEVLDQRGIADRFISEGQHTRSRCSPGPVRQRPPDPAQLRARAVPEPSSASSPAGSGSFGADPLRP